MRNFEEAKAYINKEFDEYVPASGKAENLYGEIIRAISRVGYRYFNDGDHLGVGYGKETCNAAGRFIMKRCDKTVSDAIWDAWGVRDDDEYEAKLKNAFTVAANYLEENKEELISRETEDMFDMFDKYEDRDDSYDDEDEEEYDDGYDEEDDYEF